MRGKKYSFKSFKIGLNSILRKDEVTLHKSIKIKVLEINRIVSNTYSFIKAYILYLETNNFELPEINTNFINVCFKLFYTPKRKGTLSETNEEILLEIKDFYTKYYDPNNRVKIIHDCEHIGNFLKYEAEDMIVNYENMIRTSFVDKLRKYVDREFSLYTLHGENKKRVRRELEIVKRDIVFNEEKSLDCYKEFVSRLKKIIYSGRDLEKESIHYDIKCNIWKYLSPSIQLGLNILPLRNSFIPKYITLDNECLQRITCERKTGDKKIPFRDTWVRYFSLESLPQIQKYKKKGYEFLLIKTDGKGVSVLCHREESKEEHTQKTPEKEKYVDHQSFIDLKGTGVNIVGIDPGKEDLIYCTDGLRKFRYSANQRRKECRKKEHRKILDKEREMVKIVETELSLTRSYSSDYSEFMRYVEKRRENEEKCRSVYEEDVFRTLRWRGNILRQKSESKMINNFKNAFGDSKSVVVAMGDWSQKKQMKFKEPTLGKGIRDVFRRNGYKVYLVDEFKTSITCYQCEGENKKFKKRESPRPWMKGTYGLVHGLLRCTICNRYWNRDLCSSLNIRSLAVNSPFRPMSLSRKKFTSASVIPHDTTPEIIFEDTTYECQSIDSMSRISYTKLDFCIFRNPGSPYLSKTTK